MLTRLRVQGFKNLLDVDVRLGPFTCIVGPNGVGKSNLFDAIRFLHLLTQYPIMEAAQRLREAKGRSPDPKSLFTAFQGFVANEMRFTAELVVQRDVQDDFGVPSTAQTSTLKYEVAFRLHDDDGLDRLVLIEESLEPIKQSDAQRTFGFPTKRDFVKSCVSGRRTRSFISTSDTGGEPEIRVHQEGHGGRKLLAPKSARTVMGGMASSDYPTILAAHREMQSWQTLLLEPSAMRAPSLYQDARTIDSRGGNLPGTIYRLQKSESHPGGTCAELANRLAELIDDVKEVQVRDDTKTETLILEVKSRAGVFHPARSLSDGTLRFLVLAVLAQDPSVRGVICLEEPENGIHPDRVRPMMKLLNDIAVDPQRPVDSGNPLRQIIVNTHSPKVVRNLESKEDILYLDEERQIMGSVRGLVATPRVYPKSWRDNNGTGRRHITRGQLWAYVGDQENSEARQAVFDFDDVAQERR